MQIQWYPGHMHKAQKEVREILPQVDLIIEVLDARIPYSSENPMIAELRGDKPTIKIFNKSDLADEEKTQLWQDYFEQHKNIKTLALNSQQGDRKTQIFDLIHRMFPREENSIKVIHALILGIPNVGKSTLINSLANRPIAKTGNEPAVTKMLQRIKLEDNITLFDTPGMLWANIENIHSGYRLAITGGIKETAFELPDVASYAAEYLLKHYPERLMERYQLKELPSLDNPYADVELLEGIGRLRGCLVGGGRVDMDKVSRILITEIRDGSLGNLTFEMPSMMEAELKEVEILRAEKEAKKLAREEAKRQKKNKRNRNR
ncbi:ribosome biogenesis GTPase YlqF [Hydrogenovibrio kuenenii]|uniref:ribosome biogenesis GTPase YlqF n=1 Tax=Hydrogenovibrio kuenenii TaxID=63658 RepID=UPI0004631648|nr:ribosome biogenesis GTPase YlqF [Hydrogenovibrio kuenenii]